MTLVSCSYLVFEKYVLQRYAGGHILFSKSLIKTLVQNSSVLISDLEQAFIPLGLKHPRIISYFSPYRRYTNPVYGGDNESLNSRLVLRHSNIYLKSVIKTANQFLKFV